jgi:hypothetical protein
MADILFAGQCPLEVVEGTTVSAKIRFRCFSATIKIQILRINIKVVETNQQKYPENNLHNHLCSTSS